MAQCSYNGETDVTNLNRSLNIHTSEFNNIDNHIPTGQSDIKQSQILGFNNKSVQNNISDKSKTNSSCDFLSVTASNIGEECAVAKTLYNNTPTTLCVTSSSFSVASVPSKILCHRVGAIESLITDKGTNCDNLIRPKSPNSSVSLNARNVIDASKFATPKLPETVGHIAVCKNVTGSNYVPHSVAFIQSQPPLTKGDNSISSIVKPDGITQTFPIINSIPASLSYSSVTNSPNGNVLPSKFHLCDNIELVSSKVNGNIAYSVSKPIKTVNGQPLYSGHVKYEPPPVYCRNTLNNSTHSSPRSSLSGGSHDSQYSPAVCFSSRSVYNPNSGILLPPTSSELSLSGKAFSNKLHTYENINTYYGTHSTGNLAATVIENKYASPRSSLSSQDSKHSSPRNSYNQAFCVSSLERKHRPVSSEILLDTEGRKTGSVSTTTTTITTTALCTPLPPRIEQDLEGKHFVIPRGNIYVEERRNIYVDDDLDANSKWILQGNPNKSSTIVRCQGNCCEPCPRSPISPGVFLSPLSSNHSAAYTPPPPYPGKPPILTATQSLGNSPLIFNSNSKRNSDLISAIKINPNYANIDVLKSAAGVQPPPPPPYPSTAVKKCDSQSDIPKISNDSQSPQSLIRNNITSKSIPCSTPPPPPPYPSSVVREAQQQKLEVLKAPPPPPYPSSAVQLKASLKSNLAHQIHRVSADMACSSQQKNSPPHILSYSIASTPVDKAKMEQNGSTSNHSSISKSLPSKIQLPYNVTAKSLVSIL